MNRDDNDIPTSGRAAVASVLIAILLFCAFGLYGWKEGWHEAQMECMNSYYWSSK